MDAPSRYFQTFGFEPRGGGTTVLLAEDDGALRAFLGGRLAKQGYRVLEAHHGGELLACAADFALAADPWLDAIVTDLRMPHASGADALRALRRLGCNVRVIVMSAFLDETMRTELLAAGADACLAKPFSFQELMSILPPPDKRHSGSP